MQGKGKQNSNGSTNVITWSMKELYYAFRYNENINQPGNFILTGLISLYILYLIINGKELHNCWDTLAFT